MKGDGKMLYGIEFDSKDWNEIKAVVEPYSFMMLGAPRLTEERTRLILKIDDSSARKITRMLEKLKRKGLNVKHGGSD